MFSNQQKNILLFLSICINSFMFSYMFYENIFQQKIETTNPQPQLVSKTITKNINEWEMFTMALMRVESELDSTVVSSVGAKGYLQITPVYIEEVNRIYKTNYTMKDVTNLNSAYKIFDLMQKAHNKNYDMDKAMTLHNGNHVWYKKRVMSAMKEIKQYENIRNRLINLRYDCEKS